MKFHFFLENQYSEAGFGDRLVIQQICRGLKALGHSFEISTNLSTISSADVVFLSNTYLNLNPQKDLLHLLNQPYQLLPFYEDLALYLKSALAFFAYHVWQLKAPTKMTLKDFIEKYPYALPYHNANNGAVIEGAQTIIAGTHQEKANIHADFPHKKVEVVHFAPGQHFTCREENFIKQFHLVPKKYILQVGRLEPRKNQIASIIATQDLDKPLVLIASHIFKQNRPYAQTCIEWAKKTRRHPVILLTQDWPAIDHKHLKVIPLKAPLTEGQLLQAYKNCALNLHPAFYELPGLTTLESVKLGIPTIASKWSSLKSYFLENNLLLGDKRVVYVEPTDIEGIRKFAQIESEKTYSSTPLSSFKRDEIDVAREFNNIYNDCEN